MILIRTKKLKKFELNWYNLYKIIRNEIFNIYIVKFFEKNFNNYLISENRIKLTCVEKNDIIKNWRLFRDHKRSKKTIKNIEKKKMKNLFKKSNFQMFISKILKKIKIS